MVSPFKIISSMLNLVNRLKECKQEFADKLGTTFNQKAGLRVIPGVIKNVSFAASLRASTKKPPGANLQNPHLFFFLVFRGARASSDEIAAADLFF